MEVSIGLRQKTDVALGSLIMVRGRGIVSLAAKLLGFCGKGDYQAIMKPMIQGDGERVDIFSTCRLNRLLLFKLSIT